MKRIFVLLFLSGFFLTGCKNNKKTSPENKPHSIVDSLLEEIDKGHIDGMGKIGRMHNARNAVQKKLDSIHLLPVPKQQSVAAYRDQLIAVIQYINEADQMMDKWMMEYDQDSARNHEAERIRYLSGEKTKVDNLSSAIRNSLQKADSLLSVSF